jgi:hypothetical protein
MSSGDVLDLAMALEGARRYERYVSAICPYHEDNKPSLLVYEDRYRCVACGATGRTEHLLERVALRPINRLTKPAEYEPHIPTGMEPDHFVNAAHSYLRKHEEYQDYLIKRGIGEAISKYQLGYWDGWYVVPSYRQDGSLKDILFRAGSWVQGKTGQRFFQVKGQKPGIYTPTWKMGGTTLFITFGLFDAISLALMGYAVSTPSVGKSNIKPDWFGWWPYKICILPDKGEEREANLLAAGLDWRGQVARLDYPEGAKDPNDYLQKDAQGLKEVLYGLSNVVGRMSTSVRSGGRWISQYDLGGSAV